MILSVTVCVLSVGCSVYEVVCKCSKAVLM